MNKKINFYKLKKIADENKYIFVNIFDIVILRAC